MTISVIIPTLNESAHLNPLLIRLRSGAESRQVEIIVVDGGSSDATCKIARAHRVRLIETEACRARQMNMGVDMAEGEVLYFVHADTLPPLSYCEDILQALRDGYDVGCYRFKFDSSHVLLKINAFFTRYPQMWCRGGDQSLFVRRDVFDQIGGYRDGDVIMEEYEFLKKAKADYRFVVLPKNILVSARKYRSNGYFRVQFANLVAFNMYRLGMGSERILQTYRTLINYRS